MELNTMETKKYQLPFCNNHLDILDSQYQKLILTIRLTISNTFFQFHLD
jgi:hypothetical protein